MIFKKTSKFIVGGVLGVALSLIAGLGIAANVKLNSLKPAVGSLALSDEQQAILAVRKAKASVVNIVGVASSTLAVPNNSGTPVVSAPPSSVSGTGFVVESDGLIVTNNHVVEENDLDYSVILADGTQYPAKILGMDKFDDIALIKINAENLTAATMGDSDSLETGQTVFAIGNSLGRYQNTVTRGVVSGLSRAVDEPSDTALPTMHNWIQTDAAINLGNSGGPLINLNGEVVGMDTLIDSQGDSLGFAIPANRIKDAIMQLKIFGKVSRPYLGLQFLTIDPQTKLSESLNVDNGAEVKAVIGGGPAATAGVTVGDIITGVNGITLSQTDELDQAIQQFQAGNQVMLKILRSGQSLELQVILGQFQ